MSIPHEFQARCIEILSSDSFRQIAPFFVLVVTPALFYYLATKATDIRPCIHRLPMVLDSFGFSLPWSWGSSPSSSLSVASEKKEHKSKKAPRTRAEQIVMTGIAKPDLESDSDDGYYPGLVNISGTYCFMNSTLQAMASLAYLQPYINAIHGKAEALDVPTPVIDALKDLLHKLNKPQQHYQAIRPIQIIQALSRQPNDRRTSLFNSREHQDAQELFQLLSECLKNEAAAVDKEGYRDRGLGGLSQTSTTNKELGKSVFDGLTANRRSCIVCGYTEAVMHFTLDNWQLAVPRLAASCHLEDCLEDYTSLEVLNDCICRKCSLLATHKRLENEVLTLTEALKSPAKPSTSKKKRLKDVSRMEKCVRAALEEGRIEDPLPDIGMEKVMSRASTKQAMIARPPRVLALHINRSVHYGHYAAKNNVRVIFPEVLDLTPFTTSGSLSVIPTSSISTPPTPFNRSTTPTPASYTNQRTLYRLSAVVCHYGQHSFGHYVCYRRKPRNPNLPADKRWTPPRLVDPICLDDDASLDGSSLPDDAPYVWEDDDDIGRPQRPRPERGWLRISDDAVHECGIGTVLKEGVGAFMLYYERVVQVAPGIYPSENGNVSEETLKPEARKLDLNGSVGSLISEVGIGVLHHSAHGQRKVMNGTASTGASPINIPAPRVVRNVATRRKRCSSGGEITMARSLNGWPVPTANGSATSSSLPNGSSMHAPKHLNGSASITDIPESMTASAPSLLCTKRPLSPSGSISSMPLGVSSGISVSPSAHISQLSPPSTRHAVARPLKSPRPPPGPSPVLA